MFFVFSRVCCGLCFCSVCVFFLCVCVFFFFVFRFFAFSVFCQKRSQKSEGEFDNRRLGLAL